MTVLFLFAGVLTVVSQTSAAERLNGGTRIGEKIQAPEHSIVMLNEKERAEAQQKREQEAQAKPAVATTYMTASAYNSVPGQTDGSPYLTAIGSLTRDGVVASNYFPIGTKIRIPDHYGDKVFRVEDRMNKRYNKTLDIWMEHESDANEWGRRYVKIEIVKYGKGRGLE